MTGIIRNGNSFFCAALLDNVVSQSLGRTTDYINIHPVGKACRTKFQIHIESFFNLVFVPFDGF